MKANKRKSQPMEFWKKAFLIPGTLLLAVQLFNQVTAMVPTISKQIASLEGPAMTRAEWEALRN
jgi:hypothetical protein